jgi:hypothetical protein
MSLKSALAAEVQAARVDISKPVTATNQTTPENPFA